MAYPIEKADTQYHDLRGTIEIDFPGDPGTTEFSNYAEGIGIDLNKYDPQGIKITRGEHEDIEELRITIFAVDKDSSEQYANGNNGKLPVVAFIDIDTFLNFMKCIHRMDIVFLQGHDDSPYRRENLEVIEDIYPEEDTM